MFAVVAITVRAGTELPVAVFTTEEEADAERLRREGLGNPHWCYRVDRVVDYN